MYSKKSNLSVFVCVILYFTPLISGFQSGGQLSYDFYKSSCPGLPHIVGQGVWNALQQDARIAASILRLHFHDCFVNGCDASLLLVDTDTFTGEQNAPPNRNSIRGLETIDAIKANVEQFCPSTVSCADILTLAAREAVVISGGLFWEVLLGRQDGLTANQQSAINDLPSPFESVDKITAKFRAKGLDLKDMVVLSGAHTIGLAQCFTFKNRLYNFNNTGTPDLTLAPSLRSSLQRTCPNIDKSNTNLVPLDTQSTYRFDNLYFKDIMNMMGLLLSDQALMSDPKAGPLVQRYSMDSSLFLKDFAASMVKLANIGVITSGGEIREKCGFVNE